MGNVCGVVITLWALQTCVPTTTIGKTVRCTLNIKRVPANPDRYPMSSIKVCSNSNDDCHSDHNRPFPGPTIRAQLGDALEVIVHNHLHSETTSVHFHGLHMQDNPWMDGAAGVTQSPILPGSSFTYRFNVTQTGTYWYHSHSAHQYAEGLLGPIILDYPKGHLDPVRGAYPYQHDYALMLQDWIHERPEDLRTDYRGPLDSSENSSYFIPNYPWKPHSLLINGQGDYECSKLNDSHTCFNHNPCGKAHEQCIRERKPLLQECRPFPFEKDEFACFGSHVRLRVINGANTLPLKFWIDKHNLIVVLRDGIETKPYVTKYVIIPIGQRLDVVVKCSHEVPPKNYYMFATVAIGYLPDGADSPRIEKSASALLTYNNALGIKPPAFWPEHDPDRNEGHGEMFEFLLAPLVARVAPAADERIVLQTTRVRSVKVGEPMEEWTINNITHVGPKTPILPSLHLGMGVADTVADHGFGPLDNHRKTNILQLQYGKTYEFVLIGISGQQHPWHLHGYSMDFIQAGHFSPKVDFEVMSRKDECGITRTGLVKKSILDATLPNWKEPANVLARGDTFTVPRNGYAIFRITLDNQGPWLFHCHVGWHLEMGMALIFSVEKDGAYPNIVPPPPDFSVHVLLSQVAKTKEPANSQLGNRPCLLWISWPLSWPSLLIKG